MHIGWIGRGGIDGVVHALLLVGLSELLSSTWVAAWPPEVWFLLPLPFGVISAAVFALCVRHEMHLGRLCLWSSVFCLLTWGLALVNAVEWHVRVLPLREMTDADGILLVLAAGGYEVVALLGRLAAWLIEESRRWMCERNVK